MITTDTENLDKIIPSLAKDHVGLEKIREEISTRPTWHKLFIADARNLSMIPDGSIHLVVTSPPYWNLKRYNENDRQLGHLNDYQFFLSELDKVWKECYKKLVIGGRLVVVVGDVLLSRREYGRHKVVPLHADIQVNCEKIGYDNLAPVFWHKISNATFEVSGNSKFLGKPYEPNGIIKHDIEYILMLRKNGGYRKPTFLQRKLSIISEREFNKWYQQIWDFNGASTKIHPAPFPEELTNRIVKMFSFVGDTVLDPFVGSGTTMISALNSGRNSIGIEIDNEYANLTVSRITKTLDLNQAKISDFNLIDLTNE
jgi:site-specific DNA-methyltransferase (adenine-specific)